MRNESLLNCIELMIRKVQNWDIDCTDQQAIVDDLLEALQQASEELELHINHHEGHLNGLEIERENRFMNQQMDVI